MAQDKVSKSFFPRNYISTIIVVLTEFLQILVQFLSCDVTETKLK